MSLKVASFTVGATQEQSIRWKRAAESEGFRSVSVWLSRAADAYLRVKAGLPTPLSWHLGTAGRASSHNGVARARAAPMEH